MKFWAISGKEIKEAEAAPASFLGLDKGSQGNSWGAEMYKMHAKCAKHAKICHFYVEIVNLG